jgi:hypothetical protein
VVPRGCELPADGIDKKGRSCLYLGGCSLQLPWLSVRCKDLTHFSPRPTSFLTDLLCPPQTPFGSNLSTTMGSISTADTFLELVKERRSIYALASESPIPDSKIEEIVKHAITWAPSTYIDGWSLLEAVAGFWRKLMFWWLGIGRIPQWISRGGSPEADPPRMIFSG